MSNHPTVNNELLTQHKLILNNMVLTQVLNGMNIMVILLNDRREIIFINDLLRNMLNIKDDSTFLGKRPGNLLKCKFSNISQYGCGYAKECDMCTAKNIVVEVINTGETVEDVASIVSIINGIEITSHFRERVTQICLGDEKFYMAAFLDRSSEVNKTNMERVFFHDILNTASSLYNIIHLMRIENEHYQKDEEIQIIEDYIKSIMDDIEYHRNINKAENNELLIEKGTISINKLITDSITLLSKDEHFREHVIEEENLLVDDTIKTDRRLLNRVLINIIKNALEASNKSEKIRIRVYENQNLLVIEVKNNKVIPVEEQRNIFSKGYSSKGTGRGLGTYGSKLLLNKYLNGDLTFLSNNEQGTTFFIKVPFNSKEL